MKHSTFLLGVYTVLALLGSLGCNYLGMPPNVPTQTPWIVTPTPAPDQLPPPLQLSPQPPPGQPLEQPPQNIPGELQISFTANRTNLQPGECATLQWNIQGSGFFGVDLNGQKVNPAGLQQVCPKETMLYFLNVDTGKTVVRREVVIKVESGAALPPPSSSSAPPPTTSPGCPGAPVIAFFTANPSSIAAGQSTTLSWGAVSNAISASIDQGIGGVATPGSMTVKPVKTTTYTLTATGCGGSVTKQVTVNVTGFAITPLPAIPSATPTPIIAHLISADLQVTDIFPETLPQGKVFFRVTNHGPDALTNTSVPFACSEEHQPIGGGSSSASGSTGTITINLKAGQTGAYDTKISINTNQFKYYVSCTITYTFDPKPGNNSYGEKIPP